MVTPGVSLKVLILKDSEDDALLIVDELRRGGFDPTYKRVESRERFTEELSGGWELILADVSLPSFSGGEALSILNEGGRDIPLIAISGTLSEEAAVSLLRSGAKDFIVKTNLSRLVPAVRRELGEASVRKDKRLLEQELKEKEELNQSILENSPTPISITVNAKIVYANPSRLKLAGASSLEEILGQDGIRFIHPDDLDYVLARNRAFEEGKPVPEKYEYRCLRSDGSYANIEAVSARVTYQGKPALLHVLHDVSQRKEFEEQLTGLHGYARDLAVVESLGEAAQIVGDVIQKLLKTRSGGVGLVEGRVLRFKYLYGNEPSKEIAMPLDGPGITTRAIRTGETQLIPDVTLDGGYYLVASNIVTRSEVAVPIKVDGEIVAVINVEHPLIDAYTQNDVRILEMLGNHFSSAVQRIRAAEALRASEARYRSFLDNLRDTVFVLDNDTYLYANQAGADLLGYGSPEDIMGLPSCSLVVPEDREVVKRRMEARTRGEDVPSRYELSLLRRDGGVVPVEVNVSRIMYMGKPASLAVHRDITERRQMEENARIHLKESERSDLLLENISDSVIVTNLEGIISYWNSGATSIFGYSSEEMIGKSVTLLNMSEERGDVADLQLENIRGGKSHPQEWRGARKDGSAVWLLLHSKLLKSGDGVPVGMIGVGKDITQRKQVEAQMTALHGYTGLLSEARAIDEAAEVTCNVIGELLNSTNGSLSLVENGALHFRYIYGPQIRGGYALPLDGPGITVRAAVTGKAQRVPDVTKSGYYMVPKGENIASRSELAVPVTLGGRVMAVINAESPAVDAFTENDQRLLEILAGHLSSTLARIREEEAREKHRSRLESLHTIVLQLDDTQTLDQANETASNLLQSFYGALHAKIVLVEGEELVSVPTRGYSTGIPRLPLNGGGITVRAVKEGRTIYVEDIKVDLDYVEGDSKTLSELVVPLWHEGKVIGALNLESPSKKGFTVDDIRLAETFASHISATLTRIRLAEEQRRALEATLRQEAAAERARELATVKTRFLSTATHEIRTPLTSISGYTELIQEALQSGNTSQLPAYFDAVRRNAERLTRLTDDLLDTQRIAEGKMVISRLPVETSDLLSDLTREATPGLTRRGQTLEVRAELDVTISVDRDRVIQVLANLVGNASKFSPQGSTIHLCIEGRGGEALFTVHDQGIGLAEEDVPKLFNPFPGIHVKGNTEGTGLGLSICRGIVELHGGRIWAESGGPGMGSTFSFTVPVVEP